MVTKDLDMKGMASTSGPFFPISRVRSRGKGPHSDTTSLSSSRGPGRWTAKAETEKNTGRQKAPPLLAKSRSACPKERAGSSWGALQGAACGAGDRNVQGQRAAQAHPALRTARAFNGTLYLWLETSPATAQLLPKKRQG